MILLSVTPGSLHLTRGSCVFWKGVLVRQGQGVGVQRFLLKRKLFPVTFRASFGEPCTQGEGCACPVGRGGEKGQADSKEGKALRCGIQRTGPRR